jgi:alpha-L-fucosidase
MRVNHEAIYATSASPFKRLSWGRCTKVLTPGGAILYLHVFNWPADGKLVVPGLKNTAETAYLLADTSRHALAFQSGAEGLTITVPSTAPDPISSTVLLKIKGAPQVEQLGIAQDYDGSIVLPASEARCHGDQIKYESGDARDNLGFWTEPADWADWEFTVTKPGKFEVTTEVAAPERASLEVSIGGQKLKADAQATGDYGRFRRLRIGTLEVAGPGKVTLALHAVAEGWHPLNVKSIRLRPVQ